MVVVRLALRLRFKKVPGVQGERVFRDTMTFTDPHDHGYDSISTIVEKKLRFMDAPPCDFTVFHTDVKTGDTLVVDDAYLCELLVSLMEDATNSVNTSMNGHILGMTSSDMHTTGIMKNDEDDNDNDDDEPIVEKGVSFDIEVGREKPIDLNNNNQSKGNMIIPLTSDALQAHTTDSVYVPISDITCPPKYPNFFIRGVVIAIRFKTPKPNLSVCEIDFCDLENKQQQITSMTFDEAVQKAIRENLRSDRKQVVELRNVYVRVKNDIDRRFQTNLHPFLIRMDRGSRMEVVQVLPVPIALRCEQQVITVREGLKPAGIVNLGDLAALRDSQDVNMSPTIPKVHSTPGSSSSSSIHSGAKRTMFSFGSGTSLGSGGGVPISGVVPSQLGEQIRRQQSQFLSKRNREEPIHWEPDTPHITQKDVRMRDAIVEQQKVHEEDKKERIRRRKEVSQVCIICGINCEDESTLCVVKDLLKNNNRNMGRYIPSMNELRYALSDRRLTKNGKKRNRLICSTNFVDLRTRSVHVVHCRCVHLCSGYQKGSELEDVVFCDLPMQMCNLCGMPGASVSCYHPDCNEMYHTICALFSDGYVNFGKKDPYLPCPACPRHTQVIVETPNGIPVVCGKQNTSAWWEEDEVVFDSRVVEDTDLRDPDENDGA
ncbi:uncharacterized protein TM35_000044210 [Trypanosoma theileri]|uniref:PHD-type domain-containing protein n=1 Tax=Trypanosoma theileri TaxID=67003 RepID=A0A1X0P5J9_9TRYP|nr:uncharacterized protein TM35_000044210 [Trypanosoma theileri]ORC92207.1 hypothetical protein TM35_000044210 [Trypanosoma theileri]